MHANKRTSTFSGAGTGGKLKQIASTTALDGLPILVVGNKSESSLALRGTLSPPILAAYPHMRISAISPTEDERLELEKFSAFIQNVYKRRYGASER